jgi:hypothetical protein
LTPRLRFPCPALLCTSIDTTADLSLAALPWATNPPLACLRIWLVFRHLRETGRMIVGPFGFASIRGTLSMASAASAPWPTARGKNDRFPAHRSAGNILYVTPEMSDFVKAGGLGDVSAALPRTLRSRCNV